MTDKFEPRLLSAADIFEPDEPVADGARFGDWVYNESLQTLTHAVEGYEVDLDRMTTSAEALDWIAQVAGKGWATAEIVGSLVLGVDAILHLQSTLCGMGRDHKREIKR